MMTVIQNWVQIVLVLCELFARVHHRLESRTPSWGSRIWNLCLIRKTLYNLGYFRILYLKIFQLHWNVIWNLKLPRICNKDCRDSESRTLFYFVMDPSVICDRNVTDKMIVESAGEFTNEHMIIYKNCLVSHT